MGLHFLKAFLSWLIWANMPVSGLSELICLGGGYFGRAYSVRIKIT